MGRIEVTVLPDNSSVTNEFYPTGRLKRTSGSRTYPVEYVYDAQGRLRTNSTWRVLSGSPDHTVWNYDARSGFLRSKVYSDGKGFTNNYYNNSASGAQGHGRLSTRTTARGVVTTYTYNSAGEVLGMTYSGGSPTTPAVSFTRDRLGRVTSVANGTMTTAYTFNDAGLQLTESYTGGPLNGQSVTNGFDSVLRRDAFALASQASTLASFGYDGGSRLTNVVNGIHSVGYGYEANSSLLAQTQFRQSGAARLNTSRSHDFLNRLTSISSSPSVGSAVSFAHQYNNANQRTRATLADGSYWSYGYDALGQVTSGKRYWSDDTIVAGQQFEYEFDSIGNRTETSVGGNELGANLRTAIYEANGLNQVTNREVPGYGNIMGMADDRAEVQVNSSLAYRRGEYYWKELSSIIP